MATGEIKAVLATLITISSVDGCIMGTVDF